jgi:hypothetical protein
MRSHQPREWSGRETERQTEGHSDYTYCPHLYNVSLQTRRKWSHEN